MALPAADRADWYGVLVLGGSVEVAGRTFVRGDMIVVQPGGVVPELIAGPEGVQLLESFPFHRAA